MACRSLFCEAKHKCHPQNRITRLMDWERPWNDKWSWTTEIITRRKIAHIISKFNKSMFLLQLASHGYWFSTYFLHDIHLWQTQILSLSLTIYFSFFVSSFHSTALLDLAVVLLSIVPQIDYFLRFSLFVMAGFCALCVLVPHTR